MTNKHLTRVANIGLQASNKALSQLDEVKGERDEAVQHMRYWRAAAIGVFLSLIALLVIA